MKVGYARVSTDEQNLARQSFGDDVERVFTDKASGKDTDRLALAEMMAFVREGDEILIHSIDRLARDLRDLQSIVETLNDNGVRVSFISERLSFGAGDDDALSRLQLQMLAAFAEYERKIILARQREGIAKAKKAGKYLGRRASIDKNRIKEMLDSGMTVSAVAREMSISRQSVYRLAAD